MTDLNLVSLIDPRVDINNLRNSSYGVVRGGGSSTFKAIVSNSLSNSQIGFKADPPSASVFVARRVLLKVRATTTFTGTSLGAGVALLQMAGATQTGGTASVYNFDALRCRPLSQAISSINCVMNGDPVTTSLNTYSRLMQRFASDAEDEDKEYSLSPSQPDASQNYNTLDGFPLNPLSAYGDNAVQCPRGGFAGVTITRNDSTGVAGDIATVTFEVTEPLYLSPFASGKGQEDVAFIGLQTLDVNLTLAARGNGILGGLTSAFWSHMPKGSTFSALSTNIEAASLLFQYISPDLTMQIPREVNYAYYELQDYPTGSSVAIAAGAQTTLIMNNIQLGTVPNRIFVYASERDTDCNITSTDTYFRIDRISVSYKNQDSLLVNMSIQDHYQMYLKNGGNISFTQYTKHVGSVMAIQLGTDLALDALSAPGLRDAQNLSLVLTCTNVSDRAIVPTLHCTVVSEGVFKMIDGRVFRSLGVLDVQDVMDVRNQNPISYRPNATFYGAGSFFGDVGQFLKKLIRPAIGVAQKILPQQFQPIVQGVSEVASSYGLGLGRRRGGALIEQAEMKQLTY